MRLRNPNAGPVIVFANYSGRVNGNKKGETIRQAFTTGIVEESNYLELPLAKFFFFAYIFVSCGVRDKIKE
jgi:hypothetical protein